MLPCQVQEKQMDEAARVAFLDAYRQEGGDALEPVCPRRRVFSEGIDLPGRQLDGVVVVGVGLPQVNLYQEVLRAHFKRTLGDGFLYASTAAGNAEGDAGGRASDPARRRTRGSRCCWMTGTAIRRIGG